MTGNYNIIFNMKINNDDVQVYITRNFDGIALISVENVDILEKRVMDKFNINL